MKTLMFRSQKVSFEDPKNTSFLTPFDEKFYTFIYSCITSGGAYLPIIDSDLLHSNTYSFNIVSEYLSCNPALPATSVKATNPDRFKCQFIVRDFVLKFSEMSGLFTNNVVGALGSIASAEKLLGQRVTLQNFIVIKGIIDEINRSAWNREKDVSESQSGVSTLGTISETLLKMIFTNIVNGTSFFQVKQSAVQSYGDFVLMCLPNNLWLSVKSNFAKERLMASGYTTDILGVGFFEDPTEFTSGVKIRNFQRGGFLAMYCPDVAVSDTQLSNGTNTYDDIINYYSVNNQILPTNINGRPFIRKLSDLHSDLSTLLQQQDVTKRTTVHF